MAGTIFIPPMNPLRFYDSTKTPNYTTRFPHPDNVSIGTKWQSGVYPAKYVRESIINEAITFQARLESVIDKGITVYKETAGVFASVTSLVASNITPTGWTGLNVYNWTYTPTSEGLYYFAFNEGSLISDNIQVTDQTKLKQQLVKIEYSNSINDYDMVFVDGSTEVYNGVVYLSGGLRINGGKQELSTFESDRGVTTKLRATNTYGDLLVITELHGSYRKMIMDIFSCDSLTINGVGYQTPEPSEVEPVEGSDVCNVSVGVLETNLNYYNTF